jgi:PAS domain S-box-containing protein
LKVKVENVGMDNMKKRLLLVEDEAILAMAERQELEQIGYSVHHVTSGEKAVESALGLTSEYDLILMDINLGPGIDGTQAAEQILNKKDIPVVFLSSHTEPEVVEKTEKITSYGYVVKNSGITVLDASIKMAFKLHDAYIRYNKRNQELYAIAEALEEANEELTCTEEELRKRETSLSESDNRFRSVLQLVPDMISIHDPDMNILYSNWRSFAEVPESKRNIHTKCYTTYRNLDDICPDCLAKTVLKTGKPLRKEMKIPEGIWVDVRAIPVVDENNNVTMFVEWVRDITDEKRTLEKLQHSEEEHRRLFETMSPGVVYQSADGTIISANPSAEKLLGLTADQMNGKTSMDPRWKMIDEEGNDVPGSEHPTMLALTTGKTAGPVDRAVFIPEKNDYVWLSITATPLFHPGDEQPYQVYAVFEDITKRKRAEDRLRKKSSF